MQYTLQYLQLFFVLSHLNSFIALFFHSFLYLIFFILFFVYFDFISSYCILLYLIKSYLILSCFDCFDFYGLFRCILSKFKLYLFIIFYFSPPAPVLNFLVPLSVSHFCSLCHSCSSFFLMDMEDRITR